MFAWLFGKKNKTKDNDKRLVKMRWDAASMSQEMRKHFAGADSLSANESLSAPTRKVIADRVRLEVENNSFASGIVNTLVSHCIGRGVGIQLELARGGGKYDQNEVRIALDRRENRFRVWAATVKFDRLLRLCRRARCCDGEVFVLLSENRNLHNENHLFPVAYEAAQVGDLAASCSPIRTEDGELVQFDGIKYDKYGNPVAYCLNRNLDEAYLSGQWFPADQVLHFAFLQRPGQVRGVSELASSISVFNDIRRFSNSTLAAAEAASELSFVIETDLTSLDEDGNRISQAVDAGTFIESARAGGIALPEGWKVSQLNPTNPSTSYCQFLESKIREAARTLGMPLMVALADSSGGNYSSSRADQQIWSRKIDQDRQELAREIIDPIYRRWAEIDQALHPEDYTYAANPRWIWQPFVSLDPTKDESAAKMRMENGVTTLAIECARLGLDWESVLVQRAHEKQFARELGLSEDEATTLPETQENNNE